MSKLDRQLNEASGESVVAINWPRGGLVNVDQLREQLIREIDCHHLRIPLDLRGVHGSPDALIELLQEAQRYARTQGKLLSVSAALPAMKHALNPRAEGGQASNRLAQTEAEEPSNASDVADELLENRYSDELKYDISKAEKVVRPKSSRKRRRRSKTTRLLMIGLTILLATVVIGTIEWYVLTSADSYVPIPEDRALESQQ